MRYRVADLARWRRLFALSETERRRAGAVGHRVCLSIDDPARVELILEFDSLEAAQAYERHLLSPAARAQHAQHSVFEHGAIWLASLVERRRYPLDESADG